ncbi:MAG TPA: helicase-associated domain-containing protein [Gemmataceae bacterium]|nr:helicase-associated domain-containing protein [Gemmataceae bacterium]
MTRYRQQDTPRTVAEMLENLTVPQLKPLVQLLDRNPPPRKGEMISVLTHFLLRPERLQRLYNELDPISQAAVQEATHDPEGALAHDEFVAKFGQAPLFSKASNRDEWDYDSDRRPTPLRLFFLDPYHNLLPTDLRELLLTFVPPPQPVTVASHDELPASIPGGDEDVSLRVRETASDALHDVHAVLRLVDNGAIRVSEKTNRPTATSLTAINDILRGGDFYTHDDEEKRWHHDPAHDLNIKPFAWAMLVQAGGLAKPEGSKLQLTPAGRKATGLPAHEVIRSLWHKWLSTTLLDEFSRISVIKGQQTARGHLTAVPPRRQALDAALRETPLKHWLAVDEFFRTMRARKHRFEVTRDIWQLYLGHREYGNLARSGEEWLLVQGRFILAVLFEYTATLGLVDVAYISPQGARDDLRGLWGTDDLSCLSRYDGLKFIRLNALGAWCLGRADRYEPEARAVAPIFQVLPNFDVVTSERTPPAADVLLLERFAERRSEAVWHLEPSRILSAVAEGLSIRELRDFLTARGTGPLPQTVQTLLDDLEQRAGMLHDRGTVRLIECADPTVAQLLLHDRRLSGLCMPAGDRALVFRIEDETAVRRAIRELGYVLPPPGR